MKTNTNHKSAALAKTVLLLIATVCALTAAAQTHPYTTHEDIAYKDSRDAYAAERCRLDVYSCDTLHGAPVVVWFHGGGLTSGAKYIPDELKRQGIVVVAVNYRLLPRVRIDECLDDCAAAVAWTFAHAARYGGDTHRIYVAGHSAGGYITAMLGLDRSWLARHGACADSIAALVPFSGQMISHFAYRDMNGMGNLQPLIDRYAPLFHVRADAPQLVLVTGDRNDELFGRYEENAYMWRMMQLTGHSATTLYELGGHDHGAMCHPAFHILLQTIRQKARQQPSVP